MAVPIFLLPEAVAEAADAARYLESVRPGLGRAFKETLESAFDRLSEFPDAGSSAEFGYATRRWKLGRFPYSIIYLGGRTRIVVIAIAHERRQPHYWKGR